jgi:hypothetical protein
VSAQQDSTRPNIQDPNRPAETRDSSDVLGAGARFHRTGRPPVFFAREEVGVAYEQRPRTIGAVWFFLEPRARFLGGRPRGQSNTEVGVVLRVGFGMVSKATVNGEGTHKVGAEMISLGLGYY